MMVSGGGERKRGMSESERDVYWIPGGGIAWKVRRKNKQAIYCRLR